MSSDEMRIEYVPLGSLEAATRNPKKHAIEEIKASIRRFGFVQVPAVNETTGRLVAGHGRREALTEMKADGESAPGRILVRDDDWYVPVLRGVSFETDEEAEAYLLADNRLTEIGGYDEAELVKSLEAISESADGLTGTGYTADDVEALIAFGGTGADGDAGGTIERNTTAERQPRFICICKTPDEVEELRTRLGLPADSSRTVFDYNETNWSDDEPAN